MRPKRVCLKSLEREAYVNAALIRGCADVTARIKNRYIDEFLRYCNEHAGHHRASEVTDSLIQAFAQHLYETSWQWNTAYTKLWEVLNWLRWLRTEGRIKHDAGEGLSPGKVLRDLHTRHQRRAIEISLKGRHGKKGSR